jgi:hypothetical protein
MASNGVVVSRIYSLCMLYLVAAIKLIADRYVSVTAMIRVPIVCTVDNIVVFMKIPVYLHRQ